MSRSSTRRTLSSGGFMGMMNVLMQLRKVRVRAREAHTVRDTTRARGATPTFACDAQVCNHPDLFEPRPVVSPVALPALVLRMPMCGIIGGRLAVVPAHSSLVTLERLNRHVVRCALRGACVEGGGRPA